MKTQIELRDTKDNDDETSDKGHISLQEQFVKQVKDDSLPAHQVLTQQTDRLQKEDRAPDDSAPLFVP
jgi:hypothetical protein